MSIGNLPESLSQAMLVGTMLVGRLGVSPVLRGGEGMGLSPVLIVGGALNALKLQCAQRDSPSEFLL